MTDTTNRTRVSAGVPTGGEFATEARGENDDLNPMDVDPRREELAAFLNGGAGAEFDWSKTTGYLNKDGLASIGAVAQCMADGGLYGDEAVGFAFESRFGDDQDYAQVRVALTPPETGRDALGVELTQHFEIEDFETDGETGTDAALHYAAVIDAHLAPLIEDARHIRWTMDPHRYAGEQFSDSLCRVAYPEGKTFTMNGISSLKVPLTGGKEAWKDDYMLLTTDDGRLPNGTDPIHVALFRGHVRIAHARLPMKNYSGYAPVELIRQVDQVVRGWESAR